MPNETPKATGGEPKPAGSIFVISLTALCGFAVGMAGALFIFLSIDQAMPDEREVIERLESEQAEAEAASDALTEEIVILKAGHQDDLRKSMEDTLFAMALVNAEAKSLPYSTAEVSRWLGKPDVKESEGSVLMTTDDTVVRTLESSDRVVAVFAARLTIGNEGKDQFATLLARLCGGPSPQHLKWFNDASHAAVSYPGMSVSQTFLISKDQAIRATAICNPGNEGLFYVFERDQTGYAIKLQ